PPPPGGAASRTASPTNPPARRHAQPDRGDGHRQARQHRRRPPAHATASGRGARDGPAGRRAGAEQGRVERIRPPFTAWLVVLVPDRRRPWLAVQAVTALAVDHLLLTNW
ncbi:hypothetical protein K7G98_25875, partial [Saccharothrix sp. MB29]|nr:hypothetical protein [Saccharothrix sp. MB29]